MRDGCVCNETDLILRKVHSGSYPLRGWIEGDTMFGYGLLGTLLVICLIVWIIKRL
jgi:hypothetical protein